MTLADVLCQVRSWGELGDVRFLRLQVEVQDRFLAWTAPPQQAELLASAGDHFQTFQKRTRGKIAVGPYLFSTSSS